MFASQAGRTGGEDVTSCPQPQRIGKNHFEGIRPSLHFTNGIKEHLPSNTVLGGRRSKTVSEEEEDCLNQETRKVLFKCLL